ncbi:unnamed protein product [Sphagnum troendelagicum]|uniref:Uncharacterized protein n=1 Tax=Sphagnum troendelagicum TaxID=128251 RepID=A0ABP0T8M2_9BRYO
MENQSAGGSCCQQLAEKLEKSETGRKKLRQAIAMLKEKMEDTSKVLQVNEALRQECEKERKRADAERLKSETDRKVREKVEQESLTLKEQLVQVLKRLDRVEDHQKADQSEIVRLKDMMQVKEAIDGVGGVLKAVEAAQSSFHTLERNLLAKVVVLALSTRETAQAVAKAVQKEVQALAAHVATLQKQSSSLTQHVSTLQLDSQLQGPRTPQDSLGSEETTTSLDVTKKVTTSGAASPTSLSLPSPQNVVLSKNQLQTDAVPRSKPMLTSVCPSRMRRNPSPKQVNTRADSTSNVPTIPCLQAHRPRPGPVQIITGLQSILNPSVNQTIPASTAPSLYITAPSWGSQFFDRQGGDPVSPLPGEYTPGTVGEPIEDARPDLPSKLLVNIASLLEKEKKTRFKMEEKFAELRDLLGNSDESFRLHSTSGGGEVGLKRKRDVGNDVAESVHGRKRHRGKKGARKDKGSLWETDSEGTGDELGESWWTSKNDLLSPTLPRILPCPLSPPSICLPPVQSSDGVCSSGSGQKMISPMQRKDFDEADTTSTIQRIEGVLFGREAVSGSTPQDAIEDCEIKRTVIESQSHVKATTQDGGSGVSDVGEMVSSPIDEKLELLGHSEDCRDTDRIWDSLQPPEELPGLHFDNRCGIEPNCKQAGRSQGNQPLLQKEAQAFIAVKDSLHEALVGGTTCKLQRGKDLRNGLAAVALQFDLAEALVSSGLVHLTVRRGLWEVHGCACQDGTIENARTGAKILAGLCQAHGRLDFLRRSMYTILLRCSYNNCWLLAMMSSFASICGRAVFFSGSEMATQAVCVIVSELLCDRNGNTSEEKTDSLSKFGGIASLPMAAFHLNMMEEELEVLQNCLVGENMQRMMTLLPKLLQSLYQFLTSPMCIISSTTLQCASWDETFTLNNSSAQTRPFISASVGWKWTYNELLVGHLWSMVTPGASEVTVIHVAYIVGILGRLGIVEDGEELPGVEHLRNQLREILQGAFTEPAKVAAAQALSHLKCSSWNC